MQKIILLAVLASVSVSADVISVHCPTGCPENPERNTLVFGHLYALSNNPTTKFADWVAYEVDVVNFGVSPGRVWHSDPLLAESATLQPNDYKGANKALKADRGHQAPLASFAGSRHWSELNVLSNITPQHKNLNQGAWVALESAVRAAVGFRKPLFVITGPIYQESDEPPQRLPHADESHTIPTGYFKIVYTLTGHAATFVMQQTAARADDYCTKLTTISSVESLIAFELPPLTDSNSIAKRLQC